MRRLVVGALFAAVASAGFAAPASAGCTTFAQLPGVVVPPASTATGSLQLTYCDDPNTPPPCPNVVTTPTVGVPGVVTVTPLVVNNCHLPL